MRELNGPVSGCSDEPAGADTLALADARMDHVRANLMALEVDAPLNRVGALSTTLTVKTASTHAVTALMVSVADAETTHVVAISMISGVNVSTANTVPVSMVLAVDALLTCAEADSRASAVDATMTYAGPDSTILASDSDIVHQGFLWIALATDALRAGALLRALKIETASTRDGGL